MSIDEQCPSCGSKNVYLVSGGYLCNTCEARLIKIDGKMTEVTDFVSKRVKTTRKAGLSNDRDKRSN